MTAFAELDAHNRTRLVQPYWLAFFDLFWSGLHQTTVCEIRYRNSVANAISLGVLRKLEHFPAIATCYGKLAKKHAQYRFLAAV